MQQYSQTKLCLKTIYFFKKEYSHRNSGGKVTVDHCGNPLVALKVPLHISFPYPLPTSPTSWTRTSSHPLALHRPS